jgi:hypothetical protein
MNVKKGLLEWGTRKSREGNRVNMIKVIQIHVRNRIMKCLNTTFKKGLIRKSKREGEFNQSKLYECMKLLQ